MGNKTSKSTPTNPQNPSNRALNMLQVRPNLYNDAKYDNLSVKFSRNDLLDSISNLSLGTAVRPMNGGSRHYTDAQLHPNAPQRESYLKYLSTKTMEMNGGGVSTLSNGIVNNLSSNSEGDWNSIKNMLIRGQSGGCGCDGGRVLNGGNNNLSNSSSFDLSFTNSQSTMSAELAHQMYGGNSYSATSTMNMSHDLDNALSKTSMSAELAHQMYGGNSYSATSTMNMSRDLDNALSKTSMDENNSQENQEKQELQDGGKLKLSANNSSTSMQNINYDMLLGGKTEKKKHKNSSSSSSSESSTSLGDIDASSSSSTSTTISGSSPEGVIKRALGKNSVSETKHALGKNSVSETTRALKRIEASEQKKEKLSSSSSDSSSSSSKSTNSSSSNSSSSNSSSSKGTEAFAKITRYDNVLLTSEGSDTNNVINVKQFYSSESGDLFSASSNFLRNNINKNRLR